MSTSVTRLSSDPNNQLSKPPFHRRYDSGELDVFEAAQYFSATNDQIPGSKFIREVQKPARRSLDMPAMRSNPLQPEYHHRMMIVDRNQIPKPIKESKKCKQPSSPGGKLASFLNSLFNQTHLRKKKTKPGKDFEDESPGGRRKRRSSISHFGFTTNANTPTKSYKEFQKFSAQGNPSTKSGRSFKITLLDELHAERNGGHHAFIDEKFRIRNRVSEKMIIKSKDSNPASEKCKFSEEDEGAESDSSSDLFDLPNHELDFFSNGLPVYGTTHMERINIAAPISSATTA